MLVSTVIPSSLCWKESLGHFSEENQIFCFMKIYKDCDFDLNNLGEQNHTAV